MTSRCPQGHQSATDDFCDVCGEPIDATAPTSGGGTAPVPPGRRRRPPPSSLNLTRPDRGRPPLTCPNCGDREPADALFCEECGYDFTTGQLPPRRRPPAAPAAPPPAAGADWVAELWIDPDWFAHQDAPGGCATSGAPTVVPLRGPRSRSSAAASKSRNLAPDDRLLGRRRRLARHAELTLDHDRWYVEDLGSTNGTFVGAPGEPLPDHAAHAPATPRARRRRAGLRRGLDPHHGPARHRQREVRRRPPESPPERPPDGYTQKRSDASVSTARSTSASSSSSASPATSGGASCTTGSPRSSARAINPAS